MMGMRMAERREGLSLFSLSSSKGKALARPSSPGQCTATLSPIIITTTTTSASTH